MGATYIVDLGDFDLYQKDEEPNEIIKVWHENISYWKNDKNKSVWLTDEELSLLLNDIQGFDLSENTDEANGFLNNIKDLL